MDDEKVLILLRGLPGSGKSTLAKSLRGEGGLVLSTDDYFLKKGRYEFRPALLGKAHRANLRRAMEAMERGVTPVIIDNTNVEAWEMRRYALGAVRHGYRVVVRETDTPWRFDVEELARRNNHGVDAEAIRKMLYRWEEGIDADKLLN